MKPQPGQQVIINSSSTGEHAAPGGVARAPVRSPKRASSCVTYALRQLLGLGFLAAAAAAWGESSGGGG